LVENVVLSGFVVHETNSSLIIGSYRFYHHTNIILLSAKKPKLNLLLPNFN